MKKYAALLVGVFFMACSYGQTGFGFDLGYGTSKSPTASVKYFLDKNAFSIGASYQLNNALGKKLPHALSLFKIGNGNYFYTLDAGYTREIDEHFSIEGEISFGSKKYYTNYSDNTYSQGGYHIIDRSKSIVGGGAWLFYNINDALAVFAGYNTIRQGTLGLQIKFVK